MPGRILHKFSWKEATWGKPFREIPEEQIVKELKRRMTVLGQLKSDLNFCKPEIGFCNKWSTFCAFILEHIFKT